MDIIAGGIVVLIILLGSGLVIYLSYLLIKECEKGAEDRARIVNVRVNPADARENFVAGGDRHDREAIAFAINPHVNATGKISEAYWQTGGASTKEHSRYFYDRKSHIMTSAERRFYKRLENIFPEDCYIFPQVHLDDLMSGAYGNHNDNWKAWAHIRAKSVDYVVCDTDFRIRLAIELDDWSHDFMKRQQRDMEVELAFHSAGLPLLRCRNVTKISDAELKKLVLDEFRSYEPQFAVA